MSEWKWIAQKDNISERVYLIVSIFLFVFEQGKKVLNNHFLEETQRDMICTNISKQASPNSV